MPEIHHYYHIYADGSWETPMQEHFAALKCSGLQDHDRFSLHIGLIGSEENAGRVRDFLNATGIEWREVGWERSGWEQLTLNVLAAECHQRTGVAFYAHTKGAHAPGPFNTEWRKRMTHFTVTKWREAIRSLETNHAYGCHWMQLEGNWLFGGNFWWTHMSLLRLLDMPRADNRWHAEEWIGQLHDRVANFKICDPAPPFPGNIKLPNVAS